MAGDTKSAARWFLTEPLFHFIVIGAVLYAASVSLAPDTADPNLIRVDAKTHQELAALFEAERNRLPTRDEMDKLVETFIRNEVLFREARALQLDHGDAMMRERLAQRMRLMMYSGIQVETPDDATLIAWRDEHIDRFTTPATVDFDVIGLDADEAEAKRVAALAKAAGPDFRPRAAGVRGVLRRLGPRPRDQLVALFGETFVAAVEASPEGAWTAIASPRGWQVTRLIGLTQAVAPPFEAVRDEVWGDWRATQHQKQAIAALEALMRDYPVAYEPYGADVISGEGSAQRDGAVALDAGAAASSAATAQ